MESFYKIWLQRNKEENELAKRNNNLGDSDSSTIQNNNSTNSDPIISSVNQILPTESNTRTETNMVLPKDVSQFVYENNQMQLIIEKTAHLRQKKFGLQDHLFHMKIKLKAPNSNPPLLRDILDFLEEGFKHILQNVRSFYNAEDHNIAFLTLFQRPMINGLNTGEVLFLYESEQCDSQIETS